MNASNGRNCSGQTCAWSHANSAFVQNSWKHPERWTSTSGSWDLSDCQELAAHNVSCIVSVSHVFLAGPAANTTVRFSRSSILKAYFRNNVLAAYTVEFSAL